MARPVVTKVSQATLPMASWQSTASRMASEIWSAILSGCPSVTDSEVNRKLRLFWVKAIAPSGIARAPLAGSLGRLSASAHSLDVAGRLQVQIRYERNANTRSQQSQRVEVNSIRAIVNGTKADSKGDGKPHQGRQLFPFALLSSA